MANKAGTREATAREKVGGKVAKAHLKLRAAEAKHAQAMERGKQEVERARLRAAGWEAKARERVERRANAVARLEARLLAADAREAAGQPDGATPKVVVASPQRTSEIIEQQ